jgi:Rho-binding antiterminator
METQTTEYKPLDREFYGLVENAVAARKKVIVEYFNEYRQLHTLGGLPKVLVREGDEEFLEMATGERIRLDRLIVLDGRFFPGYEDFSDLFAARCSI